MFFASTILLIDRYYWKQLRTQSPDFDPHVVLEIRERLRQLSYLYEAVCQLEKKVLNLVRIREGPPEPRTTRLVVHAPFTHPPDPRSAAEASVPELDEADLLRLNAESFYYIGHRAIVLLDQARAQLPEIPRIRTTGLLRVRNNLVEHANKKGGNPALRLPGGRGDRFHRRGHPRECKRVPEHARLGTDEGTGCVGGQSWPVV